MYKLAVLLALLAAAPFAQTNSNRPFGARAGGPLVFSGVAAVHPQSSHFALGDLNGDGVLDAVTSGEGSPSILLGQGDGSFSDWVRLQGANVIRIDLGDFNGDERLDAIGIRLESNLSGNIESIFLWIGNGDGTFQAPTTLALLQDQFSDVAFADFDGDGGLDLVTSNALDATLHWQRGLGDGTFAAGASSLGFASGTRLAVADWNGDGFEDLVTYTEGVVNGGVAVHFGSASGPAPMGLVLDDGIRVTSLVVGDPNGDGVDDVVYGRRVGGMTACRYHLGGRVPLAPVDVLTAEGQLDLGGAADLDGDGVTDLAFTELASGDFHVYPGLSFGEFGERASYASGNRVTAGGSSERLTRLELVDLDGDDTLDVLTLQLMNFQQSVSMLLTHLGRGDGTFAAFERTETQGSTVDLAIADMNADGVLDVTAAQGLGGASLHRGVGDGAFDELSLSLPAGPIVGVALGDLDNNGTPELVAASRSLDVLYIVSDAGADSPGPTTTVTGVLDNSDVRMADFDLDGNLDVMTVEGGPGIFGDRVLALFRGDGTGAVLEAQVYDFGGSGPYNHLELADMNGDGWMDAVGYKDLSSFTYVHPNDQAGGFGLQGVPIIDGLGVYAGDVDADGAADLVITSTIQGRCTRVRWGNGDGTFGGIFRYAGEAFGVTAGDVDGNGLPDLILAGGGPSILTLLHQSVERSFPSYSVYGAGGAPSMVRVADVNGDGHPDLLTNSESARSFTAHLNQAGFPWFRSVATPIRATRSHRARLQGRGIAAPGERIRLCVQGASKTSSWCAFVVRDARGPAATAVDGGGVHVELVVVDGRGQATLDLELPATQSILGVELEASAWLLDAHGAGQHERTNRLEILVRLP